MRSRLLTYLAAALCLVSCNGMFDGIYDIPSAETTDDGHFVSQSSPSNRLTLSLDATDYGAWHYVSLRNKTVETHAIPLTLSGEWDGRAGITYNEVRGERITELSSVKTDAQVEPENWDFAIHHFDVKTNGGAVCETSFTSLDQLKSSELPLDKCHFTPDEWSTSNVIIDLKEMMAFRIGYQNSMVNRVLSRWVTMDFSSPPPTFAATGRVYLLKMKDGSLAALHLRSYMNDRGVKGHLTIEIIYPL